MRVSRLYVPSLLSCNSELRLPDDKSHYLGKVLRAEVGTQLILFNGQGGEYKALVTRIEKKTITVKISAFMPTDNQSPLPIELAIGISRGDKMDTVIQKSTELGVTSITPLFTERTTVKLQQDRLKRRLDHWREVAISACEQCQRNILPDIHHPLTLPEWLPTNDASLRLVLHHRANHCLNTVQQTPQSVSLLVGPEGGLSTEELALTHSYRFLPLSLGPRVLRTETAPLAVLAILQSQWGDLNS